jgi:hypothetical protein
VLNNRQGEGLPGQKVKRRQLAWALHASQQAPYEAAAGLRLGGAVGQSS